MERPAFAERGVIECQPRLRSLRLETGELDNLRPLLSFLGDEFGEVGDRARKRFTTKVSHPPFHRRVGECCVDLAIEPFDSLGWSALMPAVRSARVTVSN